MKRFQRAFRTAALLAIAAITIGAGMTQAQTLTFGKGTNVVTFNLGAGQISTPFGGIYDGKSYQQVYAAALFPSGDQDLRGIAFTSNPATGTGLLYMNVTIKAAATWHLTNQAAYNSEGATVIYNGPVFAYLNGRANDLIFLSAMGKPFVYNKTSGNLLLDIQIHETSQDSYSFQGGTSPYVWRVYQQLGAPGGLPGPWVVESAGLDTTFLFTPHAR